MAQVRARVLGATWGSRTSATCPCGPQRALPKPSLTGLWLSAAGLPPVNWRVTLVRSLRDRQCGIPPRRPHALIGQTERSAAFFNQVTQRKIVLTETGGRVIFGRRACAEKAAIAGNKNAAQKRGVVNLEPRFSWPGARERRRYWQRSRPRLPPECGDGW